MIEVEGLTKYFGRIPAIAEVSFTVEQGEIVGLLGHNGAGKSTLMRVLACFFPPTSGRAKVAGHDIFSDSLNVRRKIGYFIENAPLYHNMSVSGFLNFAAEAKGISRGEKKKKTGKVMEECGIANVSGRLIGNLSRGYRQRVCLAQALVHDPEVLILDEPTIGLDPEQVIEVRKLISDMDNERTVLLSTHILHDVNMVCSRVIIIDQGRIIAVDTPENLMNSFMEFPKTFVKVKGPHAAVTKELKGIPGVRGVREEEIASDQGSSYIVESDKDADVIGEIASVAFKNNWRLLEIRPLKMSLEELFLKVVNKGNESCK